MGNKNNLSQIQELRNTARLNKKNLMGKTIISNIDGSDYALKITGVGAKAIRLELHLHYNEILKFHHHKHLEERIYDKINTVYKSKTKGSIWRVNRWNMVKTSH